MGDLSRGSGSACVDEKAEEFPQPGSRPGEDSSSGSTGEFATAVKQHFKPLNPISL